MMRWPNGAWRWWSATRTIPRCRRCRIPRATPTAVAKMFKDAGFQTIETYLDVGNLDFKRAIRRFEDIAVDADIAVLYLRRTRHRDRRHQLPGSDRRQARERPRRSRRGDPARPPGAVGRRRQEAAGGHPRCLPRQSLCGQDAAGKPRRVARGVVRSRQGRAVEHRHADRLRGEGRLHRRRRRARPQPVHRRPAQAPHRAWPRPAAGLRPRQGRGDEGHQRPPGAVRVRFARRRQLFARRRADRGQGRHHRRRRRREGRLRPGRQDRLAQGLGGVPLHAQDGLLRRPRPRTAEEIPGSGIARDAPRACRAAPRPANWSTGKR